VSASPPHASALAALTPDEQAAVRAEMEAMLVAAPSGAAEGLVSLSSPDFLVTAVRAS